MAARVTLTVIEDRVKWKEYVFTDRTVCTVGRAADCYLQLPNDMSHWDISRHHCLFDIDPPSVRVRDLGSRNGTYVNGRRIGKRARYQSPEAAVGFDLPEYPLHEGDEVRLGGAIMRVDISDNADATELVSIEPDEAAAKDS